MNVHVSPTGFPALVLNADFRPLSYYPLSLWSWQDAIKAVFLERVNIVANYDRAVHSPSLEMQAAERGLAEDLREARDANPRSRASTCSCATVSAASTAARDDDLTFDHLLPRSRGGHTTWGNVVAACSPCNLRKGNLTMDEAQDVAVADAVPADGEPSAPQRPALPAELSAR